VSGLPRHSRDKRRKSVVTSAHDCANCDTALQHDHVIVSVSPPGAEWVTLRFHSLVCMNDYFCDEEEAEQLTENRVFTQESWIDHEMQDAGHTLDATTSRGA
jgi:hypothetical protein